MGPVEHPSLTKQANTYTRAIAFTDLCAKLDEQRLDIGPVDVAAGWSGKDQCQRSSMSAFHVSIVPSSSTVSRNGVKVFAYLLDQTGAARSAHRSATLSSTRASPAARPTSAGRRGAVPRGQYETPGPFTPRAARPGRPSSRTCHAPRRRAGWPRSRGRCEGWGWCRGRRARRAG